MEHANKLPIQLTLVVGAVQVELGQLLEMNVGSTLEEGVTTFFPKVRAVSGDRAIAEGELVKIDDRIGFRVTKIL